MKIIILIFNSQAFSNVTHRVGAYLLLASNLVFPIGLHRPWMGLPGWWLFPSCFCMAGIGALQCVTAHNPVWSILVWPYALLFAIDTWLLALAPIPLPTGAKKAEGKIS